MLTINLKSEKSHYGLFKGYQILAGDGPRGERHAVVGFRGEMVHDPHPDGTGLLNVEEVDIFIALDPTKLVLKGAD